MTHGNTTAARSRDARYPMDKAYLAAAQALAGWVALAYAAIGQEEQAGEILSRARELRDMQADVVRRRYAVGIHSNPPVIAGARPPRRNMWYHPLPKADRVSPQEQFSRLLDMIEAGDFSFFQNPLPPRVSTPPLSRARGFPEHEALNVPHDVQPVGVVE